jgi:hypothetical protein
MASNRFYRMARVSFNVLADYYNIDAVVLRSDWSVPLNQQLGNDPEWKIVHVQGVHVLYLRSKGRYAKVAVGYEIRPDNFDMDSFVAEQLGKDTSIKRALFKVSDTFENAGKLELAFSVIETGLKYRPSDLNALRKLLSLYSAREGKKRRSGDKQHIDDLKQMKYLLERILVLSPGNRRALRDLEKVNRFLSRY